MSTRRFIPINSPKHIGATFVKDTKTDTFICKFYKGQKEMALFYIKEMNRLNEIKEKRKHEKRKQ